MKKEKGIVALILSAFLLFTLSTSLLLPIDNSVVYAKEIQVIKKVKFNHTPLKYEDLTQAFPNVMYNWKDITCLARNIYFEARNESILGQHMVAWVTVNRVKHKKWPDNVCGVVYEKHWVRKYRKYVGQFSWTNHMRDKKAYNKKAYKRAVLIAKDTLNEFYTGGEDLSNGALFYHADYVNPSWNKNVVKLAQIDTHIFYKHK